MKLSEKTLAVLNNYAGFNDNIVIESGSLLKTMTPQKNVFGEIETDQTFEREMPIYNLSEFLSCLSLFENPELDIDTDHVLIHEGKKKIRYIFAKKDILVYPQKAVKFPESDVDFHLTSKDLSSALKAGKVMSLPSISVLVEDGNLILRSHDANDSSSNSVDVTLEENTSQKEFQVSFKAETLILLDLDYDVSISLKGIAKFHNEEFGATYYIGLSSK